ncbi:glycoside hydrolase family 2 protein [Reichenbachiella versicolor]|uniref:glycoside hydrolase family 2 protein n=1 Tax=Reichenbachiella versicolor TaxID=1821036 RepID=UPI001FEB24D9|nr:glycoside hydrolase family 2 TIM barrel-domain containing protein [Reichenbachiella versicolor]
MIYKIKKLNRELILMACMLVGTILTVTGQKTQIQYLSGTDKDNTVSWNFYCSEGMNSGKWTEIQVPSCWEQQGFGNYNYGRDYKAKKSYHKEYGLYKHTFNVSEDWKGKVIKIVFEGVMTDCEVKINGKLAGPIHQGAFYEFKHDITKLLKYGQDNLLEVKVNKESSNESLNFAERRTDFWIFGGIYRPVYLEVLPEDHVSRFAVDAQASGDIKADVFVSSSKATFVKLTLQDLYGNKVQDLKVSSLDKTKERLSIESKASNIKTWNAEQPNLYQLQIDLLDKKGNLLHSVSDRIGFRTVEIRESDGIYVNGNQIKFKGVNRHSFHPSSGRTTSKALSIEHALMIKDMNMNAVRMSHYPPDKHFLDVCDSLGLFVIDELCTWHVPYLDTDLGEKLVEELIVRDVNHPSILIWANGNETGWNLEMDDDYDKWDIQHREVIHPWNVFRKIDNMHYPDYYKFSFDSPNRDKIYFPTEFLHGLYDGGHGSGLDDYWKQMWNTSLAAGGFLWDFADEGIERRDKNNFVDTDGNHGADGIVGPYGEKEASYFTIKEVWSPIYVADRYIRDDFTGIFKVENRYHFTNLNECTMTAKWVKFNSPKGRADYSVLSQSEVELPALEPMTKGTFRVELAKEWKEADALYLTATDPHGMEVYTWTYPVKTATKINAELVTFPKEGSVKVEKEGGIISVKSGVNEFKFSAETGILKEVKKSGELIPITKGPIMLGSKSKLESVEIKTFKNKVEIIALNQAKPKYWDWKENKETTRDFFKWTIYSNGLLSLKAEIRNKKIVDEYFGITFNFPEEEVAGMKWLGDGPYRVWANRMKGTQFSVWENDYNNTLTGIPDFVYPEFKGFYSNLNWVTVKGKNQNGFTVYCHSDLTFLRMLTPEQPEDPGKGAAVKDWPKGDISFVKNIPGMGTKFMPSSSSGPQGSAKKYFGNVDEPIVIDLTFEF